MRNAAVDGVPDASLCFIANGDNGVESLVGGYAQEELGHIARTKHLVHRCEMRPALRIEVWGEDAIPHALSPQELACTARPAYTANNAHVIVCAAACISTHFSLFVLLLFSFGYMGLM